MRNEELESENAEPMVNSCPAFTAVCSVRLFIALPGEPPFNSVPLERVRIG